MGDLDEGGVPVGDASTTTRGVWWGQCEGMHRLPGPTAGEQPLAGGLEGGGGASPAVAGKAQHKRGQRAGDGDGFWSQPQPDDLGALRIVVDVLASQLTDPGRAWAYSSTSSPATRSMSSTVSSFRSSGPRARLKTWNSLENSSSSSS